MGSSEKCRVITLVKHVFNNRFYYFRIGDRDTIEHVQQHRVGVLVRKCVPLKCLFSVQLIEGSTG